jgi:hypothetical protein
MRHPHVAGDEACRPVITEVLTYLEKLERMTTRGKEIPTPKFALPREQVILFVTGGSNEYCTVAELFECYSTHTDRWTNVSCTQLHSYSALLCNYKCPFNSNLFLDCTQYYITVSPESAIRVDLIELFILKFKFFAIIVRVSDTQSGYITEK